MGYNHCNDENHENIVRMKREWKAQRDALTTVRRFNAGLSAKGSAWFWPKISAANVTASPHNSAQGGGAYDISLRRAVENCRRALIGEAPLHVIGLDERLM